MDIDGLITIREIVEGYMLDSEISMLERHKIFRACMDAIKRLNMYATDDGTRLVKLEMDDNGIVDLPMDCLRYKATAIPLDGKLWTYTKDEGIITTTTLSGGAETLDSDYGEGVTINPAYSENYAAKGGINDYGYFKVDHERNRIVFRNYDRSEIFVEYVSSGVSKTSETYVPRTSKEAIEAYIDWALIARRRDVSRVEKEEAWRVYIREVGMIKIFQLPTLEEIADAWNKQLSQGYNRG